MKLLRGIMMVIGEITYALRVIRDHYMTGFFFILNRVLVAWVMLSAGSAFVYYLMWPTSTMNPVVSKILFGWFFILPPAAILQVFLAIFCGLHIGHVYRYVYIVNDNRDREFRGRWR
ncbi:hypothetical protein [Geotalea sp. SG265]|uniref:hypothetical protein n=1 Tax=Geotalea sp. SG265 TaxID=2922867 RepID=UPI001FAE9CC3|nr:hypothetical protein [Geotalea sp. SG265]